jgi:hypothetical protein
MNRLKHALVAVVVAVGGVVVSIPSTSQEVKKANAAPTITTEALDCVAFQCPNGRSTAVDAAGNIWVVAQTTWNNDESIKNSSLVKIANSGTTANPVYLSSNVTTTPIGWTLSLKTDSFGNVWYIDKTVNPAQIVRIDSAGTVYRYSGYNPWSFEINQTTGDLWISTRVCQWGVKKMTRASDGTYWGDTSSTTNCGRVWSYPQSNIRTGNGSAIDADGNLWYTYLSGSCNTASGNGGGYVQKIETATLTALPATSTSYCPPTGYTYKSWLLADGLGNVITGGDAGIAVTTPSKIQNKLAPTVVANTGGTYRAAVAPNNDIWVMNQGCGGISLGVISPIGSGHAVHAARGIPQSTSCSVAAYNTTIDQVATDSNSRFVIPTSTAIVIASTIHIPKLATPSGVAASATAATAKSIDVAWPEVTGASSYTVKIYNAAGTSVLGTKSGVSGTSTTLTTLTYASMADNTSYMVSVTAVGDTVNYDDSAESSKVAVTTNVNAVAPTISSQPVSLNRTSGQSATLSVTASTSDGGTLSYIWKKDGVAISGEVAPTLSFNPIAASDAGSYIAVVTNTLSNGVSSSSTSTSATLSVVGALSIETPTTGLSGTANTAFSLSVPATGGRAPLTYALTGTLVNGLNFNTSTGTISGTPTVSGSSTVSVTVTDANGATASTSNFTLTVATALTIATPTTGLNKTGLGAFSRAVPAAGGRAPLTYALTGILMDGLSLNTSTGTISGTPTVGGSSTVSVTVTDANGATASTSNFTIYIHPALIIATPMTGLFGTADSAFSLPVPAAGGRAALTYSLTGTLMDGLSFNTSTGTISGTPTVAGSSTVSVTVTDVNSATASTSNFTISIGYATTTVALALASSSPQYRISNTITATTSRAGTVNFKLDGSSIAGCESVVVASTTATCAWSPVNLGAATLTAEFTPAASNAYSISTTSLSTSVSARAITVTPTAGQSKAFGDSEPIISYTITSGSLYGLDTLTGALSRVPGEDAGTYSITGGTLSNPNYVIAVTPINFVISQVAQSAVSLTTTNGVYATGLNLEASGGSGSGGYSFAVISAGTAGCSISSGVLNATSPGTCTVAATRAASTNYLIASSGATTVTISKATQSTVSLTSTSGTFNANISLSASGGTGTGSYSFSVTDAGSAGCSFATGPSLTSSSAGSCTVTVTRAGDNNYESRSSMATLVTFAKDSQNALTLRDSSGDLDSGITLSTSGGSGSGAVSYSVTSGSASCSITSGVVNARFAGSCTLTTTKAADVNYLQKQITNTLTFIKATQSAIQVTSVSGTYGTPIQLTTSGGSGSGAISYAVSDTGSASCVVSGSQLTFTSAGTCKVIATRDADSVFDARSSISTTITIDRSNQTPLSAATTTGDLLTGIIVSVTGGGGTGSVSTSVTSGTANCTLTAGVVTARNFGTCSLSISKAGDTNFFSASTTVTLTFAKAIPALGTVSSPLSSALGTGITLAYTGGTGNGAVTYTLVSSGTAGCSITNGVLNATSGGKCSVTITKQGDDTYADQVVTTEFTFVDDSVPSTTTTIARAASTGVSIPKATSTTSTTLVPTTTVAPKKQVLPPSLVNTESAAGAATIGGKTTKAKTTRVNNQLVFTAGGFTVTLAGVNADGTIIPLSSEGLLEVKRGDMFRLDAQGFAPNSSVDIWMFSKTFLMDTIEVGADGLVKSTLKVPKSVEDGLHHLVMVGVDKAKKEAKFEVGMNVGVPPKQWWYSRILIAIPISIAVFIGFWLPTSASRRRRRRA